MPSPASNLGTGATITFGTSGFTARFNEINMDGISRQVVPTPYLAIPEPGEGEIGNLPKLVGKVIDPGRMTGQLHFKPDTIPPINDPPEAVTITWADGTTWAFSGAMVEYNPKAVIDGLMIADTTVEACGPITVTEPE